MVLTRLGANGIVTGTEMPFPVLELMLCFLFLKIIGIGENVIGMFNYFSITSCNFLNKIIRHE